MIKVGIPPLQITLNPAVVHSPIFLYLACHVIDLSRITMLVTPPSVERAKIVTNDPVAAANVVIDSFVSFLLGFKQPGEGIFGQTCAYYGCIEEQGAKKQNKNVHLK